MKIYYPSCTFTRIDPVSAKELVRYARSKDMTVAGCCHFDKHGPEEGAAVYFCQACREDREKNGFDTESFWEVIDNDPDFVFPDYSGLHVTLQDCWRDRHKPEIHKAVRSILDKMHIRYEETDRSREHSAYCGTLHYETVKYADTIRECDHITHLGKETAKMLMEENVQSYKTDLVVCVCGRCYNGILLGGGHPVHLMTLLTDHWRGREKELYEHSLDLLSKPDPREQMKRQQA